MPPAINRPKAFVSPLLHPSINRLFIARPPLDYLPFQKKLPNQADKPKLTPICHDIINIKQKNYSFPPNPTHTKCSKAAAAAAPPPCTNAQEYVPFNGKSDPFKTIIVSRLPFGISERRLRREFERFGMIASISMIVNSSTGKARGYAFIEYERERDARMAYKEGDGLMLEDDENKVRRRIIVDVERGRTVKGWRPRRLGGGLGGTRFGSQCYSERRVADNREQRRPSLPSLSSEPPPSQELKRQKIQYDDIY